MSPSEWLSACDGADAPCLADELRVFEDRQGEAAEGEVEAPHTLPPGGPAVEGDRPVEP